MRFVRTRVLVLFLALLSGLLQTPAQADNIQLTVAEDKTTGYNRSAFKHWIDADKDGCDTRAEVLIEEAVVKPKIGPKCKLTGGKWVSVYDGKTITNPSQLDVDHLVPLAEAWRSGAWSWTTVQRQAFANDLGNWETLIAVSANTNRSKSDKDPALWMPSIDRCVYIVHWVTTKWRYSLSVDVKELNAIEKISQECFGTTSIRLPPTLYKVIDDPSNSDKPALPVIPAPVVTYIEKEGITENRVVPIDIFIPEITGFDANKMGLFLINLKGSGRPEQLDCGINQNNNDFKRLSNYDNYIPIVPISLTCDFPAGRAAEFQLQVIPKKGFQSSFSNSRAVGPVTPFKVEVTLSGASPTPTPTPSQILITPVTPGAFCSPAGAIGKSSSGVTYTCKSSSTDSRNRWRQ